MITKAIVSVALSALLNTGQFVDESVDHRELACLTEAIFFEAKSESDAGKAAIANVILNRTRSGIFPTTVCDVTSQKGQFQFKRDKSRKVLESDQQNAEKSAMIALKALQGGIEDNTKGALYFVNPKIATYKSWLKALRLAVKIENHHFYKPRTSPS